MSRTFNELIKEFNLIRSYSRDFYINGFKHREEFQEKSLRRSRFEVILNLNRMLTVQVVEKERDYLKLPITSRKQQATVTCLLTDKRQTLTRSMLHFADYHKATRRMDDRHYALTIHYDKGDETELLIRILSFGPFLKVTSPDSFVAKIKVRIDAQAQIMATFDPSNKSIE